MIYLKMIRILNERSSKDLNKTYEINRKTEDTGIFYAISKIFLSNLIHPENLTIFDHRSFVFLDVTLLVKSKYFPIVVHPSSNKYQTIG